MNPFVLVSLLLITFPPTPVSFDDLILLPMQVHACWAYELADKHHTQCQSVWVDHWGEPAAKEWWQRQAEDADTRRLVWYWLRIATDDAYGVQYRLSCLSQLRDRLGWRAYYQGQLPPPLPNWRLGLERDPNYHALVGVK